MAAPRIFVSSTCYDLQEVRGNLRDFIHGFGYEPIMSDFGDIFYDFNTHVQQSCIDAIKQSDLYVLIVGDNYGSTFHTNEKKHNEIPDSVTLKEFKEALDLEKSKIVFVNKYVDYDYNNYKRYLRDSYTEFFSQNDVLSEDIENKKNEIRENVEKFYPYPKKSYKYIFYFLDKIYEQKVGNAIHTFESSHDIKETLKKQWAGFVQESLKKREEQNSPVANEFKRVLDKLSKIEKFIETKFFEIDRQIDITSIDKKVDELSKKRNLLNSCMRGIFFAELPFASGDIPRFVMKTLADEEKINKWMEDIVLISKKYKWSGLIDVKILFQDFEIEITEDMIDWNEEEISYEIIFKLSELIKSLSDEDKESCLITLKGYFDKAYDLGFPF